MKRGDKLNLCLFVISIRISDRNGDHFLSAGQTGKHFSDSIFAQRAHPGCARALTQDHGRSPRVDHVAHSIVHFKNLKNSHPAFVAGPAAMFAADRAHDIGFAELRFLDLEGAQFRRRKMTRFLAVRAESPNESLGHDCANGSGDEERLDSDVDQAGDR